MGPLPFEYDMVRSSDGTEVFNLPGPDMLREKLIVLHTDGASQLEARLGAKPSRSSLVRWRDEGYPIDRNGPRVRLPTVVKLKRVYTSTPALTRWLQLVQLVSEDVQRCGGTEKWRKAQRKRRS